MLTQFLRRNSLPILSGILIGTSYIPSYPVAVFWSFVPLWLHWMKNFHSAKSVFFSGWITQFLLTLIGFHWVAHTAHEFGHLPWSLSVLALLAFCAVSNLHVAFAGLIWSLVRRRFEMNIFQSGLMLATLTALGELFFPMIFPWNHGYVWLWAEWQGFQFMDVIGAQGLSLLTLLSNAYFLWLWKFSDSANKKKQLATGVLVFLIAFFSFHFLGKSRGETWNKTDSETNMLVVQANIGNLMKYVAEQGQRGAIKQIAEKYFKMTFEAVQKNSDIDFIVWPETAYPEFLNPIYHRTPYHRKLKSFVKTLGIPLMTGGYRNEIKDRQVYNSFFFVDSDGNIQNPPYSKSILLAFGEYFPGAETFPFLKEIVPAISDFKRGPGPKSFPFYGVNFGPQICYEGLYPDFSRGLSDAGAQIFVNLTNDSWFGDFFENYQHLYMTLSRAVEFRRPLLRSTNTGFTTAILANGDILQMSPQRAEWSYVYNVKYLKNAPSTFFAIYGYYIRHFFIGLFLAILLWVICGAKKAKP